MIPGEHTNAFEEQEPRNQGVLLSNDELIAADPTLRKMKSTIDGLKALGLYKTAEFNQRKLDRLLQEKREPLEG